MISSLATKSQYGNLIIELLLMKIKLPYGVVYYKALMAYKLNLPPFFKTIAHYHFRDKLMKINNTYNLKYAVRLVIK
jgi:hypothetical protein